VSFLLKLSGDSPINEVKTLREGMIMKKPVFLTRVRTRVNKILKGRAGQSTTEYILILAIVVMIAGKLKSTLSTKVLSTVDNLDFNSVMSP
jgi:hypothetical protein